MLLRISSLCRLAPLGFALGLGLSGCADTIVPALEAASRQHEGPAGAKHKNDTCFISVLYTVDSDQFTIGPSTRESIDTTGMSSGTLCGQPGDARRPGIGICQHLAGYDGYARLLWNDEVVDEFTIDEAFLTSGTVEVLAYDAGEAGRYEYHLYTRPDCSDPWPPSQVLTREQVEAMEK